MNKFFLPPILILAELMLVQVFNLHLSLFNSLLLLVVLFTFFHSLDIRDFVLFSLYCGFLRDIFSLDFFGMNALSYVLCAFCVSAVSNIIYRHNWVLVFPLVFAAVFLNSQVIQLLKLLLFGISYQPTSIIFVLKVFAEAIGTSLLVYPLYQFFKRCVPEFIE